MPYLNVDLNYFEHTKTRRLVGILGENADVLPLRLWAYCGKIHAKDGAMKSYSDLEIEGVIRWSGAPGEAIAALIAVGFIKQSDIGFYCVDWRQHQGHLEAFSRRGSVANKIRWDMVRKGVPVGVQKHALRSPPTYLPTIPTEPARQQKTFTPPTVQEIKAYCVERKNSINPQDFHDHYETRGWIPKGYTKQMKSWQAAVRTWEKYDKKSKPKNDGFMKAEDYIILEGSNDAA